MSTSSFNRVVESIDANLAYLHKERWALEAAQFRNVVRNTAGADKEHAQQALRDHYLTENHPETSRGPLVQQALANDQAQHPA